MQTTTHEFQVKAKRRPQRKPGRREFDHLPTTFEELETPKHMKPLNFVPRLGLFDWIITIPN